MCDLRVRPRSKWIRIPSLMYASVMLPMVAVILAEEMFGVHAGPQLAIVLLANAPWALFPLFLLYRMAPSPHPFTRLVGEDVSRRAATASPR